MTLEQAAEHGYVAPRYLPDGRVVALLKNLFTVGVVIVGDNCPTHRWCYEDPVEAVRALLAWDGVGDPPGNWIKQKLPVERMNPNWRA